MKVTKISTTDHPIIFFDGECKVCNTFINQVFDADKEKKFKFCHLSSTKSDQYLTTIKENGEFEDTVYLLINGKMLSKSTAVLAIAKELPEYKHFATLAGFIPTSLRDNLYDFIAKNRKKLGKQECRLPSAEWEERFV